MKTTDRINRARWSRVQKELARDRMAKQFEQERVEKLAELKRLAETMRGFPQMATLLASVEQRIASLS